MLRIRGLLKSYFTQNRYNALDLKLCILIFFSFPSHIWAADKREQYVYNNNGRTEGEKTELFLHHSARLRMCVSVCI